MIPSYRLQICMLLLKKLKFHLPNGPLSKVHMTYYSNSTVSSLAPSSSVQKTVQTLASLMTGKVDHFNGITVDLSLVPASVGVDEFFNHLGASLQSWRDEGRIAAWLIVPINCSHLIPAAVKCGFLFHHAEGSKAVLKLWLDCSKDDATPQFATHQVGVSGVVLREETRQVLVVQDRNRRIKCKHLCMVEDVGMVGQRTLWKFPGGLADLGEDIESTAVREVLEETGVQTEYQSVLAFRQQHDHPGAFGRSDLYVLCRLRPLTYELRPCAREIRECRWMTVEELRLESNKSSITQRITDILLHGLQNGFDKVDIVSEEHESIHKDGVTFKLFFRPLSK